MQSQLKTVNQVQTGDFTGLNLAGLARLSFEVDPHKERPLIPRTGEDYSNREEQERVIREFVEARGGTYVYTYDEPDTSAWKKKRIKQIDDEGNVTYVYRVVRPVLEGAFKDLKRSIAPNGKPLHGLVVARDDRLTRDGRHLEDAIEVVEYHDRPIIDVKGNLDLLTKNGRNMARVRVTMLNDQSSSTSERVAEKHYANAIRGIPVGGRRPFGWNKDKRTLRKREAKLIKDTFKAIKEGVGLHTIEDRWFKAGVLSPLGNPMRRPVIRNIFLNPRIAGIRTYRQPGKPLYEHYLKDTENNPIMGQWDAILTIPEWQEVVAILTDHPSTGQNLGRYKYLSSGHISCGECGGKLEGHSKGESGYYQYSCNHLGCGKVSGSGKTIDRLITEAVHDYFANYQVSTKEEPWEKADELEELNVTRKKLSAQYSANIDLADVILPKIRETDEKITKLTRERRAHTRKASMPKAASIVERWDTLEMEQKRAIVGEVFEVIILNRATKGANKFDPERLKIVRKRSLSLKRLKLLGLHMAPMAA